MIIPNDFRDEFFDLTNSMPTVEKCFFYAQIAHESGEFRHITENLNYSARALLSVFGKYFDTQSAKEYARNPEKIANRVYANRMGNGDEKSGDGWKYRGGGLIQITGKENYQKLAKDLNIKFDQITDYVRTSEGALRSAVWFWEKNNLSRFVADFNIKDLTRAINGGYNGLDDRIQKTAETLNKIFGTTSRPSSNNKFLVECIQSCLNTKFSQSLKVDGDFGKITEAACLKCLNTKEINYDEYFRLLNG